MPLAAIAAPTSGSLRYEAAVSIIRYPSARASSTAAWVSSGGVWKTPNPSAGKSTPLLRRMSCRGAAFIRISMPAEPSWFGLSREWDDDAGWQHVPHDLEAEYVRLR